MRSWFKFSSGHSLGSAAEGTRAPAEYQQAKPLHFPGGPPGDETPQWLRPFPPHGWIDPPPAIGLAATEQSDKILRRAVVIEVARGEIVARVEYRSRPQRFVLARSGLWHPRGYSSTRLVLGVAVSNLKSYKLWWRESDLAVGPISDADLR